jgi:DNA-binding CsgD family transcriptional regulator
MEPLHFVGRDAELESVRSLVYEAGLGAGSALIWLGAGGVGKSRLLRECATMKLAAVTASARCGRGAASGAGVVVQLARSLRLPVRRREKLRVPAVLAAIGARAKRRPLVLFLDDLHLADSRERSFLDALVSTALHHQRIAVVACAAFRDARDDLWERDGAAVRALLPLDEPSMELLVRALASEQGLAAENLHEIIHTAQGNPRYAAELVESALEPGAVGRRVPASARAATARLRQLLTPGDFDILLACSAVGEVFFGDWIGDVTRRPRGEVADALQRASESGVLFETSERPGWLAFREAAIRNALYESLIALKRRVLHERIVDVLAANASDSDPLTDEMLGYHAESIGDFEQAATAYARAADRLFDATTFAAAATFYVRAVAHLPAGQRLWIERLQRAIRCYRYVSDWANVRWAVETLFGGLDRARNPDVVAAELENMFLAQLNDGDRQAAERTAEEIASLGTPDSERRGQIATLLLAYCVCYSGSQADAARLLARVHPKNFDDAELSLRYFLASAEIGAFVTPLERTLALVDRAAHSACGLKLVVGRVLSYAAGAEISCRYGNLERAREYIGLAEQVAEKGEGQNNDAWRIVVKERTRIALLAGDLVAARELVRANVGWLPSGLHNEAFDAYAAVTIGMRTGDLALVDAFFNARLLHDTVMARDAESCGLLFFGFADVMQVRGMAKDLRMAVERCIALELIDPYTAIQFCATRFASIECAARALEQTEAYFAGSVAPAAAAHVALCKAALLHRQGRHIAAAGLAAKASAQFAAMGWRLYEATAFELAGDVRGASRRFDECGATSDVLRLASKETRKLKHAPFGARLSPREREVARLVAAKRSNREIARALEISVRTVDHHVEAAFSKLGIRARWELIPEMLDQRG